MFPTKCVPLCWVCHPHTSILNVQLLPVILYIICFIISHSVATPEWSRPDTAVAEGAWKNEIKTATGYYVLPNEYCWAFIHPDVGVYHTFLWLRFLFLLSLIICAVLPISHTFLTEMEECIPAIANHIDPLGRSPHPNLLSPDGK